jgi:hypothetical protein
LLPVHRGLLKRPKGDGGFEVVKVENNARGMDQATLNATNLDTGERCWGQLKGEL